MDDNETDDKPEENKSAKKAFFACFCGKWFKDFEKFNLHKEEKHKEKKKLKCEYCDFESKHLQHITRHKEKCKPENVEKCVACDYKISSQYKLYEHERLEHGINTRSKIIARSFKKRKQMSEGNYHFSYSYRGDSCPRNLALLIMSKFC